MQGELTPDTVDTYVLKFKPSRFTVAEATPDPPSASRVPAWSDARSAIGAGIINILLFGGGTVYLIWAKSSWWAILTGIFCLGGGALLIGGISNLLTLKQSDSFKLDDKNAGTDSV